MSFSSLFEYLLTPSMEVIFFGIIVVLLVPLVLHTVLMGNPDHTNLPVPKLVELKAVKDAKDAFRAHDDKTPLGKATTASFSLLDTPGHPKLRRHALDKIRPNINEHQYKAVVFVVDAAALGDQPVLADAAEYLYDDDLGSEANDSWLGEYGSSKFAFDQLDEFDISVDVLGGNVTGQDGPSVDKWWQWIAYRM
ncbi:hypothetical protein VdG1_07628 [Verticillium dahliae VDG1]|nr:hypothetical protein VdG1_07628 [Verticillium dahliae VDG1]